MRRIITVTGLLAWVAAGMAQAWPQVDGMEGITELGHVPGMATEEELRALRDTPGQVAGAVLWRFSRTDDINGTTTLDLPTICRSPPHMLQQQGYNINGVVADVVVIAELTLTLDDDDYALTRHAREALCECPCLPFTFTDDAFKVVQKSICRGYIDLTQIAAKIRKDWLNLVIRHSPICRC